MATEYLVNGQKVTRQNFECGYCDVQCLAERNAETGEVSVTHDHPECNEYRSVKGGNLTVADYMRAFIERKQAKLKALAEAGK